MAEATTAKVATPPITVSPLTGPVTATWAVPGSKSITNRAFILAALANGTTTLHGVLHSDDTRHMRNALTSLGIKVTTIGETSVTVLGGRERLRTPKDDEALFIGNSGTSVRFLTVLAALVPGQVTFVGDEHMAKRPLQDLVDALGQLGVKVECETGCPPLKISGGDVGLPGGEVHMPGNKSSQYFSALMLSGGMANENMEIHVEGELVSRPYVNMTIKMVNDFGGSILNKTPNTFTVNRCPTGGYLAREFVIEPDASSASYPFAAAAATGSTITVPNMSYESLQGDYNFVDVLAQMGCKVEKTKTHTRVTGPKQLKGIEVDMHHISDTVMTLAALAPLCDGPVKIVNVANIRIKETDRLIATVNELRRLGQEVNHGEDWFEVIPKPVVPAQVECYADHRMAMAFAILGLARPGVTITDPDCTAKTYPNFWVDLEALHSAPSSDDVAE